MSGLTKLLITRWKLYNIKECFEEGAWVGAGEVLMYLSGRLTHLADLETIFLQKLGGPCVAAFNAFGMTSDLPNVAFIAMDARHCAGKKKCRN